MTHHPDSIPVANWIPVAEHLGKDAMVLHPGNSYSFSGQFLHASKGTVLGSTLQSVKKWFHPHYDKDMYHVNLCDCKSCRELWLGYQDMIKTESLSPWNKAVAAEVEAMKEALKKDIDKQIYGINPPPVPSWLGNTVSGSEPLTKEKLLQTMAEIHGVDYSHFMDNPLADEELPVIFGHESHIGMKVASDKPDMILSVGHVMGWTTPEGMMVSSDFQYERYTKCVFEAVYPVAVVVQEDGNIRVDEAAEVFAFWLGCSQHQFLKKFDWFVSLLWYMLGLNPDAADSVTDNTVTHKPNVPDTPTGGWDDHDTHVKAHQEFEKNVLKPSAVLKDLIDTGQISVDDAMKILGLDLPNPNPQPPASGGQGTILTDESECLDCGHAYKEHLDEALAPECLLCDCSKFNSIYFLKGQ